MNEPRGVVPHSTFEIVVRCLGTYQRKMFQEK